MSKAQSIIEQFYQEEQTRLSDEATFSPLDMSMSSADMALISTIAKRFNKDKALLAREALSHALEDMFSALEPVERKMLAKESDELANSIATEMAEDLGMPQLEVSGTNWVMQDKNCIKAERKAEKEKAKQEAAAQKVSSNEAVEPELEEEPSEMIEDPISDETMESTETSNEESADTSYAQDSEEETEEEQAQSSHESIFA